MQAGLGQYRSRVQAIRYTFGLHKQTLSDLEARATDHFSERVQKIRTWLEDTEMLFLRGLSKSRTAESEDGWLANRCSRW